MLQLENSLEWSPSGQVKTTWYRYRWALKNKIEHPDTSKLYIDEWYKLRDTLTVPPTGTESDLCVPTSGTVKGSHEKL